MAKNKAKNVNESEIGKVTKTPKRLASQVDATGSSYADGTPFDQVQYLEAKLILKPDRFTSVQSFRDFGKIVRQTAKKLGVGFIEDEKAGRRPEIREIIFLDTPPLTWRQPSAVIQCLATARPLHRDATGFPEAAVAVARHHPPARPWTQLPSEAESSK